MSDLDVITEDEASKHRGQWVAVRDRRVLFGAEDPDAVFDWLDEHREKASLIFRVATEDEPTTWRL